MARTQTQLSIAQAGERLGLGYRRTRQLIASGDLRAASYLDPYGRLRWAVTPQAVSALLRKQPKRKKRAERKAKA